MGNFNIGKVVGGVKLLIEYPQIVFPLLVVSFLIYLMAVLTEHLYYILILIVVALFLIVLWWLVGCPRCQNKIRAELEMTINNLRSIIAVHDIDINIPRRSVYVRIMEEVWDEIKGQEESIVKQYKDVSPFQFQSLSGIYVGEMRAYYQALKTKMASCYAYIAVLPSECGSGSKDLIFSESESMRVFELEFMCAQARGAKTYILAAEDCRNTTSSQLAALLWMQDCINNEAPTYYKNDPLDGLSKLQTLITYVIYPKERADALLKPGQSEFQG